MSGVFTPLMRGQYLHKLKSLADPYNRLSILDGHRLKVNKLDKNKINALGHLPGQIQYSKPIS